MSNSDQTFPAKAIPYLLKYVAPLKWHILVSMLLVFTERGVGTLGSWFFAQIVEAVKGGVSEPALRSAVQFVLLMALCSGLDIIIPKITFLYRQKYVYFPATRTISHDTLAYLQGHAYNYLSSSQTGNFVNKIDQVAGIQPVFSMIMVGSWSIICEVVIKGGILMLINIWLGSMFLLCCILSYLFNILINKKAEHLAKMTNQIEALHGGWMVDVIANLRLVKQFSRLAFEQNRLFVLLKQQFNIKKKELGVGLRAYTSVGVFINLCAMAIIAFAVYLWSKGDIGVGAIVFVLLTVSSGLNALIELHDIIRNLRNRFAAINESLKPFVIPHEIKDISEAQKLAVSGGGVEFKDIVFSYKDGKKVFKDFNLHIKPGEKVGIVGKSGSGKTTLINLLQRAFEPMNGQITVDGQDIAKVSQNSLHQSIALIPQETTLFHRSIKDNIAFGAAEVDDEAVIAAAKKAYAEDFIKTLPQGYETIVGDRGCKLSGGEKQRVAIARAILKNSPILILDEATSSLDSESEDLISQAISKIIKGKTVIAIAHRLSTLKEMDRIIVLEKGKVVEEGMFAELCQREDGKFRHFYELQKLKNKKGGKKK